MAKTGKLNSELAMELFEKNVGKPVTPTELANHVGTGPYASKHVWELRKQGVDVEVVKEGRTVKHYLWNGKISSNGVVLKEPVAVPEVKSKKNKPFDEVPVPEKVHGASFAVDKTFDTVSLSDIEREFTNLR